LAVSEKRLIFARKRLIIMKSEEINKKEFELNEQELDSVSGGSLSEMVKQHLYHTMSGKK
jgi:hypothetical protein